MRAALDDAAVVEHHDRIRILNGRQAVRDDKDGTPLHERIHALLHEGFGAGVDGGSRLVEDHHGRIRHRRAGNGDELPLPLREVGCLVPQHGIIAFRQTGDKVMRIGELCRLDAFLIRRVQLSVADVLHDRARKQVGILQDDTHRAAQVCLFDLIDIDAVVTDLAVGNVVEAVQEVGDGGLAGTCRPDKGDLLPGLCIDRDVVQHDLFGNVTEIDVKETDIPFQLGIGDGAVRLVRVLPCPLAGTLLALGNGAVRRDLCVDEGDVAVIRLRLFVEQLEDTSRARKAHDDRVDLHGDLADVQGELAGHVQKRSDDRARKRAPTRNGEVLRAEQHQQPGDDRDQYKGEVADVHDGGHQDVTVSVRLVGRVAQVVVDLVEVAFGLLFVAEDLDDLLASHHLLDVTLRFADDLLLLDKVAGAAASDEFGDHRHDGDAGQDDEHQPQAIREHDNEQCDCRNAGIEHLRDAHGDELAQRVGIVGVYGHDVAVGMRIKIADRQRLHFGEHVVTDMAQKSLRDDRHRLVVEDGCAQSDNIHQPHTTDDIEQRLPQLFERRALRERCDDLIDDEGQKHGRADAGCRSNRDANEHGDHSALIVMEQIPEQPAEQLEGVHFRLFLHGGNSFTHGFHLPLLRQTGCRSCSASNTLPDRSRYWRAALRACRWR